MTAELDPPDLLAEAIERIRRSEPPADGWPRALARHRAVEPARSRQRYWAIGAVAAVAAGLALVALWPTRPEGMDARTGMTPRELEAVFPPNASAGKGAANMGITPVPHKAVASIAPVIVTTAGKEPLELGGTITAGAKVPNVFHVWDWEKSATSKVLDVTCDTTFAVTPDGKAILCADGRLVDIATGKVEKLPWWQAKPGDPTDRLRLSDPRLVFSPDGKTLVIFEHNNEVGIARLVDFPAGTERTSIPELWFAMFQCAFTPDGKQVVMFGKDACLRTFDTATGKEVKKFEPAFDNSLYALAVSPDGKKVAGCHGNMVRVWELATGKLIGEPDTDQPDKVSGISALVFSPDGKFLAGGGSLRLMLWNLAAGTRERLFPKEAFGAGHLRFSPDGKVITLVGDFHIRGGFGNPPELIVYPRVTRWSVETGAEIEK